MYRIDSPSLLADVLGAHLEIRTVTCVRLDIKTTVALRAPSQAKITGIIFPAFTLSATSCFIVT